MSTTTTTTTTTATTTVAAPAASTAAIQSLTARITADNLTELFPDVTTTLLGDDLPPNHTSSDATSISNADLSGYDEEQIRMMDEQCIILSLDDEILGAGTKKVCHQMTNINKGLLHRAFSCFLFHPQTKKLLLQQRASEKITFPDMWTNTCCSHPLAHPSETGVNGDFISSVDGAKRAATRKLGHELGIPAEQVPPTRMTFLTRIHYLAPSGDDGKWGEHEMDYILFAVADPTLDVNVNEVQDIKWVSQQELRQLFRDVETQSGKDKHLKYTPWFRLICEGLLFKWWDALEAGKLAEYEGETQIRRM